MAGIDEANSTAEPRLAASVILVRDAPVPEGSQDAARALEVFVQHRVTTMDFAAGMVVFPGGRVDQADSSGWDFADDVVERHAAAWHRSSIAVEPSSARFNAGRVLAAAQREVFEEAGVKLDAATLRPWANWVTPADQPKRFDTYFYLACPVSGAEPRHQTTEASSSLWMPVRAILDAEAAGTLKLMPPTLALLDELLALGTMEAVLGESRDIVPVRPKPGALQEFFRLRHQPPSDAPELP
ncbi:NUDIX hydrolase [Arthrobacter bambusae]|uniref:NUDIX hydrolase n=1 Tax=Arthrobacter bambusae TaxID=1338426 RepID=UPI002781AE77|nr:NUDIX domain-containing protein [Arthrobacter bambusae]MDQ0213040.1 8-oxo-dGTP pyrophosphatase MutT (NUDIX family) [Arthrobacter bambusae]MDQ0237394.1 8-oxo-dGTP pyrophosphatase MutT (NUDIX family) [Arthrobacter bambusae]